MAEDRISAIEERLAKATPGPWRWGGNLANRVLYLWGKGHLRPLVMDFLRWGTVNGQPRFNRDGLMFKADGLAVREVPYRDDVVSIDHPDADLIAAAPSDLRYLLDALRESREELGEAVRLLDDIDGAMSLGSVRRGVALMQDVAQADWVFGTLKKIRAYLAARHPEPVEEEPNG